jgi:hypothetical protein
VVAVAQAVVVARVVGALPNPRPVTATMGTLARPAEA